MITPFYRGKVRDLYDADPYIILVASDRLSAFDVVFHESIPDKGKILTGISCFWFNTIRKSGLHQSLNFTDHMVSSNISEFPEPYNNYQPFLDRSVLVKKTKRIDYECVVRGYLAGSGYKDYLKTGSVCGHKLPPGLALASKLPSPIFTPATKAPEGKHDENISIETMRADLGDLAIRLEDISIAIFRFASELMLREGIILCDTKFEFGLLDGNIVLIDEVLTPDSSRYWNLKTYSTGSNPPGYDKQYVRDFLENSGWNKEPPPPMLPSEVIAKTQSLYKEIESKIQSLKV